MKPLLTFTTEKVEPLFVVINGRRHQLLDRATARYSQLVRIEALRRTMAGFSQAQGPLTAEQEQAVSKTLDALTRILLPTLPDKTHAVLGDGYRIQIIDAYVGAKKPASPPAGARKRKRR